MLATKTFLLPSSRVCISGLRNLSASALAKATATSTSSSSPSTGTAIHPPWPDGPLRVSPWQRQEALPLTRQAFLDLLDGRTPAINEPGFLSKEVAQKITDEVSPRILPYQHVAGPPLEKVGVAQFEFQAQSEEDFKNRDAGFKDRYFEQAAANAPLHDQLTEKVGDNPWARIMAHIASLVPEWDVVRASEGPGRTYFSGIYRVINKSTPIHCDWSPFDSATEDWIVNRITRQAVFNLYCADFRGGETLVYDVQWSPEAMRYRDPATPGQGDLCLFNSRNMHEVKPVQEDDHPTLGKWSPPRVTLSSFMGLLPESVTGGRPQLIFWS
ncbi:hypothetical protein MW887_004496 [Aspergillus wentii]|nr:hypothetical protein MW887_004496 [Aspergillus wentii]